MTRDGAGLYGASVTEHLIAEILSGEDRPPPAADDWPAWLEAATRHGVLPLLFDRARSLAWDSALLERMRVAAAADTAVALAQVRELRSVLDGLAGARIDALLIKGAHLGLSHYASPALRPRRDTDLLIHDGHRDAAAACLQALGYEPLHHVTGDVAFLQRPFWRIDDAGCRHGVDLHWRIANPRAFSERLTWEALYGARASLPAGGPHAFGLSTPHALIVACIHRSAHHANSDRLIWLFDIRVLAASLSDAGWDNVVTISAGAGIAPVVADGLRSAAALVRAPVPADVLRRLGDGLPADPDLAPFVEGRQTPVGVLVSDWRRLTGWRCRTIFLREHLFPDPAYIFLKYGVRSRAALPFLYAHRLVTGARKWLAAERGPHIRVGRGGVAPNVGRGTADAGRRGNVIADP
jgi:hypothetical protein